MRRALIGFLALAAIGLPAAHAQYPVKPIRILLGFTSGSLLDLTTRLVAPRLADALGQQVIVENKPGASSNIATEQVIRAPADGYTLLMGGVVNPINTTLYASLPFDFIRDTAPIVLIGTAPSLLVVHPSVPVHSVRDLIDYAKKRPGEVTFGSSGNGTAPHLAGEMLNLMAGIKLVHVPYKSSPQAMTDLLAGRVHATFSPPSTALPHLKAGTLRGIASTGARRASAAADLPTMIEAGLPDYAGEVWMGLFAPAATPRAVIERINREVVQILAMPELRAQFAAQAIDPLGGSPESFADYVKAETAKWAQVVRASGAKVD
ncbi:MAG: tripartite tricarboxylate transporter substrate binding protein [Betaproteobacteria bacterium]|nr:tripartite tricarboxylate transporter substrate binding protein [Betaproteobacteria bacterium]